MPISKEFYDKTSDGHYISIYSLTNGSMKVKIIDYGGIITNIFVPDKDGKMEDIALGFDTYKDGYDTRNRYFGALVGRYANRIAKGQFTLDGVTHQLAVNNGPNALHGGINGFDKRLWASSIEGNKLVLKYTSADGEENYPGEVKVTVTYQLTDQNELILDYTATTNKKTIINLTNHSYFNLAGHAAGTLDGHFVRLAADKFTPVDDTSIPTGAIDDVNGTMFDLTSETNVVTRLPNVPGDKGFDHNFVLGKPGWDKHAARLRHTPSGRQIDMYTTEPGFQFYTGYYLGIDNAKGGANYRKWSAFCLEAQHYPDSPNQPSFPSTVLSPGETYRQTTKYVFSIAES
ncbi:galactose mutarotase-like [Ruditapes philippinarum]|uniref:galactose mutarotase-like n=1 Tax=Ruditapes philippinarum TaxID=129788 RepID=UPI00295BF485|nr:galactose mutarotase-like [Ruditapes philippinarum]